MHRGLGFTSDEATTDDFPRSPDGGMCGRSCRPFSCCHGLSARVAKGGPCVAGAQLSLDTVAEPSERFAPGCARCNRRCEQRKKAGVHHAPVGSRSARGDRFRPYEASFPRSLFRSRPGCRGDTGARLLRYRNGSASMVRNVHRTPRLGKAGQGGIFPGSPPYDLHGRISLAAAIVEPPAPECCGVPAMGTPRPSARLERPQCCRIVGGDSPRSDRAHGRNSGLWLDDEPALFCYRQSSCAARTCTTE